MRIDSGGEVAINMSPVQNYPLTVKSLSANNNYIFLTYNSDGERMAGFYQRDKNGELYIKSDGDATKVLIASNADSYFNGGNVGIGITTPQTTLQVNGAASALNAHFGQGQNNSSGIFGGISLGYAENTNAAYRKVAIVAQAKGDGAARQDLHFLVDTVADGNSAGIADSKMSIQYNTGDVIINNNLGIGNTSPNADIHIKRTGDASIIIEADSDNVGEDDNPTLFLRQDGAIITSRYGINGSANNQFTGAIGNAAYIHAMGAIQLAPDNGQISATFKDGAMLIDGTGGEVPNYKLDIRNAGSNGINITGTGAFVRWNSGDMQIRNGGGYKMSFDTWNGSALTEHMSIASGGTVYVPNRQDIGTQTWTGYGSNPIAKLNIEVAGGNALNIFNTDENEAYLRFIDSQSNGAQYAYFAFNSSTNYFTINNMGNNAITLKNNGYVGINNTDPTYRLHVKNSNNVSIFEDTSDASGAAFIVFNRPGVFSMGSITRNGRVRLQIKRRFKRF
jgi:hypothetical protein